MEPGSIPSEHAVLYIADDVQILVGLHGKWDPSHLLRLKLLAADPSALWSSEDADAFSPFHQVTER